LPDFLSAFARIAGFVMAITGGVAFIYYASQPKALFHYSKRFHQTAILPRLIKTLRARHSQKQEQLRRLSKLDATALELESQVLDTAQIVESQSNQPILTIDEYKSQDGDRSCRDLVRSILRSSHASQLTAEEIIAKAKEAFPESSEDPEFEVLLIG
jgi:hypothetical protein